MDGGLPDEEQVRRHGGRYTDYDDVEINIYIAIYWTCDIASLIDLESIGLKTIIYHLWGISVITLR